MKKQKQRAQSLVFKIAAWVSLLIAIVTLSALLIDVLIDGFPRLSWDFITGYPSRRPGDAGLLPALVGSFYLIILTALISIPTGIAAAIYLEEYATESRLNNFIEINIANLAAVPSIVYGILGLGFFVRFLQLERSLLAGALTMSLLILPIIIISTREAIRTIPNTIREASYALGATKWQTIQKHILPISFPNILTGIILAVSRAIGETAPLITIGALTYMAFLPDGLQSPFTALPIQIFNWVSRPQAGFHINAAAGIIILLLLTLLLNSIAILLRNKYMKK